jgi:hypothetical protein
VDQSNDATLQTTQPQPSSLQASLLQSSLPPIIPPIRPLIFQPRFSDVVTFVGGVPMSLCAYQNCSNISFPSPSGVPMIHLPTTRGSDKSSKRKRRKCHIWCNQTDCLGGKSGPTKRGELRHCSNLVALISEYPNIPKKVAQKIASY